MRRRDFLALTAAVGSAAAFPRVALAQQAKGRRIAYLSTPQPIQYDEGFQQGLVDHGYIDGKNITVLRFTAPTQADLSAYAAMAVASKPDIIATGGTPASLAAKAATGTIPIVFANISDPVAAGLVTSLAVPGGNLTGNTLLGPDLAAKQVEIIKEILPDLSRLAILDVTDDPAAPPILAQVHAAAAALKIEPVDIAFLSTDADFAKQFQAVVQANVHAVHIPPSSYLAGNATNRALLVDLLLKNKMPAVGIGPAPGANPSIVGLVGYGPNSPDLFRQSGTFIDAILKGAKPGDLPVAQPTSFEFVINLNVARAFGLTIPDDLLASATDVIDDRAGVH